MWEQTPDEARTAFRKLAVGMRRPEDVIEVSSVTDAVVPGAVGELAARVYRPAGEGPFPTVVFFHGGGFVVGDLDTHDNMARAICRSAEAVVVSVDYRLAPEHPFPAAVEDAVASTLAIRARLTDFGGDDRLAVAGDSAGGNLSAVVTQHVPGLAAQFLIYPATDPGGDYASRHDNAEGYFLDLPTMVWFTDHYAADPLDDPRFSPLRQDSLSGLPPAVVVTAELDPLCDEGLAYAAALEAAGVPVVRRCYDGMIHGFMDMAPYSEAAGKATDDAVSLFADVLAGTTAG